MKNRSRLETSQANLFWAAVVCAAIGLGGAGVFLLGRRGSWRDPRPMPWFLRFSFGVVAVVALIGGAALVMRAPRVCPWPLASDSSVMYGLIFLGATPFFGYGFFRPMLANATVPLLAFRASDVVLIGPFLMHFATVRPAHRASLVAFTVVLLSTGALAVYYLFVNRSTRVAARRAPA